MPFFGISTQERFFWTIDILNGELPARKTVLVGHAVRLPWIIKFHSTFLKGQFRLITGVGGGRGGTWEMPRNGKKYFLNQPLCLNCANSRVFSHARP